MASMVSVGEASTNTTNSTQATNSLMSVLNNTARELRSQRNPGPERIRHGLRPPHFRIPSVPTASDQDRYFVFPNGRVYRYPLCEDFPIHSLEIAGNALVRHAGLNEDRFFALNIPEGCVMNRLLQPDNIGYDSNGRPLHRISCCLLKQEILPAK